MNFEPADPPLLDPFILERFTEEEIKKQEQNLRHQYVLKKLAEFLPSKDKKESPRPTSTDIINSHINSQLSSMLSYHTSSFSPNVHVQHTPTYNFQSRDTSPLMSRDTVMSRDTLPLLSPTHVPTIKPVSPTEPRRILPAEPHRNTNVIKPRATKRFTYSQSAVLEEFFQKYGSARIVDRIALAQKLGLYKNDVIGWFQSRRRKERRATSGANSLTASQNSLVQGSNNVHIFSSGVR